MNLRIFHICQLAAALILATIARAHDEPTSFVDLRLSSTRVEISATASVTDLAHGLPGVEPDMLLRETILTERRDELAAAVLKRLQLTADGAPVQPRLGEITAIAEKRDLQFHFTADWPLAPVDLRVDALLFPYDPRHKTFVNVYSGEDMLRQEVLAAERPSLTFPTSRHQGTAAVFGEFVKQGVHHIVIGWDHILFVIGLLLLGGGVKSLLKIVTAFTLAHSITLALATFRIITPPPGLIEPVIAASIVFVGLHALLGRDRRDPRLAFAFVFGLVHGFGFANVLQEMVLPRQAMGMALFAFNLGVEIAQAAIVLAIAPLLALLRRTHARLGESVAAAGALSITAIGAFWFFERVLGG